MTEGNEGRQGTQTPPPPRLAPQTDFEELFGGRVLAWAGGIAIALGFIFLLGIGIDRGWLDETMRTILGLLGSTFLLLAGVWAYERKGQTQAALAAAASALAGLYVTLLVGTQVYDLIPAGVGLACAGLVGIVGAALAIRWQSVIVAAIGIFGALLAPVLVGSGASGISVVFMAIALAAAVGVHLWQRWEWLSVGAFVISAPQLLIWVEQNHNEHLALTLGALVGFWVLYTVAAIGYELRARTPDVLPVMSWLLLLANVVLITGAGYIALEDAGHQNGAVAWLLGLALGHILLGGFALRREINKEIGLLLVALGLGLSAFGFAEALDGPVLVIGWAGQAAVLAYLATRANREPSAFGSSAERLLFGAAGFFGLALGHALVFEARPDAFVHGVGDLSDAMLGLGACFAAALYGRFALRDFDPRLSQICEAAAAVTFVYLGSIAIVGIFGVTETGEIRQTGQAMLSVFWALTGLGSVVYGLSRNVRRFRLAGLAMLALTILKVYAYDSAELEEVARVISFIGLGLFLLVGAFAYQRIKVGTEEGQKEAVR